MKKTLFSFPLFIFVLFLIFFVVIKFQNITISLSDTNEYFYFGHMLLQGKILYKDILHADLPLFPYICALYFFLTAGHLQAFYFTSTLEVIAIGVIIFLFVRKEAKGYLPALFSSLVFLFSGFVLQLSDFQEGVFTALLFGTLGFVFYKNKKGFYAGIFLGLAVSTKLYMIPIVIAALVATWREHGLKNTRILLLGFFLTCLLILAPFLLTQFPYVYQGIIGYSLHRPPAVDRIVLFGAFAYFNIFLVIVGLLSVWNIKKHLFVATVFLATILATLIFPDLHYLYFAAMVPFLAIASYRYISPLAKAFALETNALYISGILITVIGGTLIYYNSFAPFEKVPNINAIVRKIKTENPTYVYGLDQLVPAIAYLSGTPLLDGIIDTNENMFRKGVLNKTIETRHAIEHKAIIISYGRDFPAQNIHDIVSPDIVDVSLFSKHCSLVKEFPVDAQGGINTITLSSCQ